MATSLKKKIARHAGKLIAKDAAKGTIDHLRRCGPDYELRLAAVAAVASALALSLRAWRVLDERD